MTKALNLTDAISTRPTLPTKLRARRNGTSTSHPSPAKATCLATVNDVPGESLLINASFGWPNYIDPQALRLVPTDSLNGSRIVTFT
jgi:hypothetical protein